MQQFDSTISVRVFRIGFAISPVLSTADPGDSQSTRSSANSMAQGGYVVTTASFSLFLPVLVVRGLLRHLSATHIHLYCDRCAESSRFAEGTSFQIRVAFVLYLHSESSFHSYEQYELMNSLILAVEEKVMLLGLHISFSIAVVL